jgi:hypothetical protein
VTRDEGQSLTEYVGYVWKDDQPRIEFTIQAKSVQEESAKCWLDLAKVSPFQSGTRTTQTAPGRRSARLPHIAGSVRAQAALR